MSKYQRSLNRYMRSSKYTNNYQVGRTKIYLIKVIFASAVLCMIDGFTTQILVNNHGAMAEYNVIIRALMEYTDNNVLEIKLWFAITVYPILMGIIVIWKNVSRDKLRALALAFNILNALQAVAILMAISLITM